MTGEHPGGLSPSESGRRSSTLKPCSNCRRRKVRCCKSKPCSNCVRSGMKCIYEGTGSSDESILSRVNMPNSDLQDRLCRLENLMESMAGASISDTASQNGTPSMARTPYVLFDRISSQPEELGKTVFGQLSSVYVDPSAWVHSFSQVEQLSYYLDGPQPREALSLPTSSNFIFSFDPGASPQDVDLYPAIKQSEQLVNLFFQNVEPFMMILHQGLFRKELDQYRRRAHPRQVEFEALLMCIHAVAIATLPLAIIQALFAESKEALAERFGHEAERSLARCGILKSRSIICLQALLCHITFLLERTRYDEGSALVGVAVRLAQRIGLSHDPSHFNFSPWEADQRRRLWLYIQHLDFRCCDTSAAEALCTGLSADCKRPKNVDDSQWEPCPFSKKSSEPESVLAFREMTFVTLRHEVESVQSEIIRQTRGAASETAQTRVMQYRALIEQRFLQYFDESDPMQRLVALYIRSRIDHIEIIARHRSARANSMDERLQKSLFVSAVELLESISRIECDLRSTTAFSTSCSWLWVLHLSLPWYAIAVTLTSLTTYFQGPLVTRAWAQIDAVFARFSSDNFDLANTPIWTPIHALRDQALFRRETWLDEEAGTEGTTSNSEDGKGVFLNPNAMSMARAPMEIQISADLKSSPVDVDDDLGVENVPVDLIMPDLHLEAENDFFDFFALSSDRPNEDPNI